MKLASKKYGRNLFQTQIILNTKLIINQKARIKKGPKCDTNTEI